MSTIKRVYGDYQIQTVNSTDQIILNSKNVTVSGNLSINGDTAITGNIVVTKIFSGTSNVDIPTASGPVVVAVAGTPAVATFSSTGIVVSGIGTFSGNVTGGNLRTAGQVSATGNITGGNISAAAHTGTTVSVSANITGGNLLTSGLISSTGNITGGNILGGANVNATTHTGTTVSVSANITGGNLIFGSGQVTGTGNVTGGNLLFGTGIVSGTGNVVGGNIVFGSGQVTGTGNVVGGNLKTTSVLITTTTVSASGNITGGNLVTAGLASITGNVIANNLSISNIANVGNLGASYIFSTNNANVGNLLTPGYVSATGSVTASSLLSSGNVSAAGNIIAGTGKYFIGDGGFISNVQAAANVVATAIANGTTSIQVVDSGGNLLYTSGGITVATWDSATAGFTANIRTSGNLTALSNVTGSNISTSGLITATGNVTGGNIIFGSGQVTGTGNVTGGNFFFGAGTVSGSGNVTGGQGKFFGDVSKGTEGLYAGLQLGYTLVPSAVVQATTNTNDYTQINQQNLDSGNTTSADYVVTANDGSDTDNYIDFGLAGSGWDGTQTNSLGNALSARDGYMYVQGGANPGGNLVVGTGTSGYVIKFIVGGNSSSNIKATMTSAGLSVTGVVNSTGNITGGNLLFGSGQVSGTGNITGGNLIGLHVGNVSFNAGTVSGTGNIVGGNLNATNLSLSGNIISAVNASSSISAGTTISAVGNITGGNLATTNISVAGNVLTNLNVSLAVNAGTSISAAGNITGGNILGGANVNATTHTGTTVSVSANITGGNILFGSGQVTGTGNITGGNILFGSGQVTGTGNVTGGNLNAAGLSLSSNVVSALNSTSAITTTANITGGNIISLVHNSTGNVTLTSTAANAWVILTPTGTGTIIASKDITNGQANGVGNIGSSTGYFNTIFGKATTAQYADLAENYLADQSYAPGTVLVFGGTAEVTANAMDADRRIAGVVSTNPAHLMNSTLDGANVVAVALVGRVPTSVVGTVRKGDTMVAAGNGAARAEHDPKVATIIGKALEDFNGDAGIIEVVVGRL